MIQDSRYKIQEKGQLALLSLLIIGAITLAAALSASFVSRTEIGKGFRASQASTAQAVAESCFEEAMYRLKSDAAYEGGSVNIGDGTCAITIINDSATVKSITVIGSLDKIRRKIEAKVQISPFKILSRTEAVTDVWHQTDWGGGVSSSTASHNNGDQTGWNKYESENSGAPSKLDFTNKEVKMAHHDYSWTQTDDGNTAGQCAGGPRTGQACTEDQFCNDDANSNGTIDPNEVIYYCEPGFKITGAELVNTRVLGSGNITDIELSGYYPRDGDLIVNSGSFNLQTQDNLNNTRAQPDMVATTLAASAAIGATQITVSSISGFGDKDNIMIIVMYGSGGTNQIGDYEEARILGTPSGNQITLKTALTKSFDAVNYKIQVIRIPTYNNVTVNPGTTLTASAYSSSAGTGGILFFRAVGMVINNGTIHMNGAGYIGGGGGGNGTPPTSGTQGSSFQGVPTNTSSSPNYGGGGAGLAGACGVAATNGGGASHATIGGNGVSPNASTIYGTANLSVLTLGSGGGGGSGYRGVNADGCGSSGGNGGAGGNGGGIVRIQAGTIDTGNGYITANGNNGGDTSQGDGGGGAGGSVYLEGAAITLGNGIEKRVYANGGTGAATGGSGRIRLDSNACYFGSASVSGSASCLTTSTNPATPYQQSFQGGEWADTFDTDFNNTASSHSNTQTYGAGLPAAVGLKYTPKRDGSSNNDNDLIISGTVDLMTNDRNGTVDGNQPSSASARVSQLISGGSTIISVSGEPVGCANFSDCFTPDSDGAGPNTGDEVMIIEMYGQYAGQYETAFVFSVSDSNPTLAAGATITLDRPLTKNYDTYAQVVRVPKFGNPSGNVTVCNGLNLPIVGCTGAGILTASAYSSSTGTGGILFFRATGTVTNNGTIDMTGRGYLGGAAGTGGAPTTSGTQGSSFQGSPTNTSSSPNYGGGGAGITSGCGTAATNGGSASHAAVGGNGVSPNAYTIYGSANLSVLTLGSGGGGGSGYRGVNADGCSSSGGVNGGAGGNGGGIVRIQADIIDTGNGYIMANGNNGGDTIQGDGGGGAGGSVYLEGVTINMGGTAVNRVTATGGTGGGTGGSGYIRIDREALNGSGTFSPAPNFNAYTNSGSATGDFYSTINRGTSANNLGKIIWNTETEAIATVSGTPTTTLEVRLAASNTATPATWTYQSIDGCAQTGKKVECPLNNAINDPLFNNGANQYLRYWVHFTTTDASVTPKISDVRVKIINYDENLIPVSYGTYTSGIHDFGQPSGFTKIIWNMESGGITPDSVLNASITTPAALKFQIAGCLNVTGTTCNDGGWNFVGPDGTANTYYQESTPCAITGTSLTNEKIECDIETMALNGKRYARYKAYMTAATGTGGTILDTPYLQDVKILISRYETGTYELVSSPFDSGDSTNVMKKIQWTESLPATGDIQFQIHTAPDNGGMPGAWTNWCGPTACDNTAKYTDSYGAEAIFSAISDQSSDRWFQYKATIINTSIFDTPKLKNTQISYELADKR